MQQLAQQAESAGATGLWACDHLFWHLPLLEPLTALAVVATASSTATIGTCVLQLPIRDPASVARQAATLQAMTDGRFVLGVGVGSHAGEYAASGARYSARGRLLDDGIARLREAWDTAGRDELRYRLEPRTSSIPVWLGGSSEAALRRAARVGDGWVPLFLPPHDYELGRRRLAQLAGDAGRNPDAIETSVVAVVCLGDSVEVARKEGTLWLSDLYDLPPRAFERHLVAGTPEDCAAGIAAYHEAGAAHVVVMIAADETLEHFGPVAEALRPAPSSPPSPAPEHNTLPSNPDRPGDEP